MEGKYDIILDGKCVGQAEVSREGLYYRIICHCQLPEHSLCKIQITCEAQTETLGTLVPEGEKFVLCKKVPTKQFPGRILSFHAIEKGEERFVPVFDGKPFPYVSKLNTARLERRNGQLGIVLRDV